MEHDACGVGFVANVTGVRTHDLVEKAMLAVVNVTHRGAVSADGKSGDGAGLLLQLPERLLARELSRLHLYLPDGARLGVGMFFLPQEPAARDAAIGIAERAAERYGLRVLGWRDVPVNPDALGDKARTTMPSIQQLLVATPTELSEDDGERRLYL